MVHDRAHLCALWTALFLLGGCTVGADRRAHVGPDERLPETIIELHHPSRQVAVGLQVSPLSGYPTLLVRSGNAHGRFILDTGGAGALIVSESFLKHAGGKPLAGTVANVNGTTFPLAIIPQMEIGDGLVLRNVACIVGDLSQMQKVCGNLRIDGILTLGALQGLELDIHLPQRVVHFRPALQTEQPPDAILLERPSSHRTDARPFAVMRIGETALPTLLDTGNYTGIDIPAHLLTGQKLIDARDSYGSAGFHSRAARTQRGRIEHMRLDGIALHHTAAQIIPHTEVSEAVLGIAVLQHYRIIYNTRSRTTLLLGPTELHDAGPNDEVVQLVEDICRRQLGE